MSKQVMIMSFDSESKAFQAFTEIKILHSKGIIKGEQMTVLKHTPNHLLEPIDFIDFTGKDQSVKGSLIGMVIGILAGPLGVLLGWFTGSVIGSFRDVKEIKGALSIFEETINLIPENTIGAILIATEEKEGHVNDLIIDKLDGKIVRIDQETVEEDISMAVEAGKEAKKGANDKWYNRNK